MTTPGDGPFTATELILTANTMDAAGVPPNAGEDAVRAVALVLRHLDRLQQPLADWEIEYARKSVCDAPGSNFHGPCVRLPGHKDPWHFDEDGTGWTP